MDPKPFHKSKGAGNRPIGHDPHDHVHTFRRQGDKVPKIIMGRLRLGKAPIGFLFGRVDNIRKFDGVLNKKHRYVVPDKIPVPFFGI